MTNEEILAQAAGADSQAQQPVSSLPGIVAGSGGTYPKTFLQILEEEMNHRRQVYRVEMETLSRGGADVRGRETLRKILRPRSL